MNVEDPKRTGPGRDGAAPGDGRGGTGEGAGTALQALIRKRKLAEQPDPPDSIPPAPPPP